MATVTEQDRERARELFETMSSVAATTWGREDRVVLVAQALADRGADERERALDELFENVRKLGGTDQSTFIFIQVLRDEIAKLKTPPSGEGGGS